MIDGTIDSYAHKGLIEAQHWLAQQLDSGVRPEDATLFDVDDIAREAQHARRAIAHEFAQRPREPLVHPALQAAPSDAEILERRLVTCSCGHFKTFLGNHCHGYTYGPRVHHTVVSCAEEPA